MRIITSESSIPGPTGSTSRRNGLFHIQSLRWLSIANQLNVYNRVLDDVAQIGWGMPDFIDRQVQANPGGRAALSERKFRDRVGRVLAALSDRAARQRIRPVVPLKLIVFPQSGEQFREQPATLDNLNGLKVVVGSKISADVASALGGAPWLSRSNRITRCCSAAPPTWSGRLDRLSAVQARRGDALPPRRAARQLAGLRLHGEEEIRFAAGGRAEGPHGQCRRGESRAFGKFWDDVNDEWRDNTANCRGIPC